MCVWAWTFCKRQNSFDFFSCFESFCIFIIFLLRNISFASLWHERICWIRHHITVQLFFSFSPNLLLYWNESVKCGVTLEGWWVSTRWQTNPELPLFDRFDSVAFISAAPYSSAAVISGRDSELDRLISLNSNRVRSTVIKSLSVLNQAPLGENEGETSAFTRHSPPILH